MVSHAVTHTVCAQDIERLNRLLESSTWQAVLPSCRPCRLRQPQHVLATYDYRAVTASLAGGTLGSTMGNRYPLRHGASVPGNQRNPWQACHSMPSRQRLACCRSGCRPVVSPDCKVCPAKALCHTHWATVATSCVVPPLERLNTWHVLAGRALLPQAARLRPHHRPIQVCPH